VLTVHQEVQLAMNVWMERVGIQLKSYVKYLVEQQTVEFTKQVVRHVKQVIN